MADNYLPYQNPTVTDAKLDSESLVVGANTVHRERIQISGTGATDIAPVSATDGLLVNLGANNDVTITSSVLPTGAATAANQTTIIGHVDGIEGLLTTIAGAVAGTEIQVDVLTMPTVTVQATNLDIRDLVAASDAVSVHGDVGIIDQLDLTNSNPAAVAIVDGNGDQITSFGGGTQYTEDAAAAANPVGNALIVIREDARAGGLTTTDGDNVALRGNNKGELYVKTTDSDALLTTIDADTSNISTKIDTIAGAVSGTEMQVDVLTSALPSGASTSAKQDTQITAEQAIQTSVELIDDAIKADDAAFTPATTKVMMAGFQVDETATDALDEGDAGAARIDASRRVLTRVVGATDANRLDIDASGHAQVDIAAVSTTLYIEQPTHDSLNLNANAQQGNADVGAANPLQVTLANGSVPSHAVTNAGTFVVQENGAALTALQLIDDPIATDDTTTHSTGTTKVMGIGAVATPTDASVNANDIGMPAMTTDRKLHVAVMDALPAGTAAIGKLAANSGVDIGDVDVTSVIAGTGATNLGKAEDAAHTTGDTGVMMLAVRRNTSASGSDTDGDYSTLNVDVNGQLWVTGTAIEDVAHSTGDKGVFILGVSNEANTARAADGDYVAIATDTEGNTRIVGNRDHDAVDAGEPVKIGAKAIAHGSNPTAVAAADRTDLYANRHGIQFVIGGHPNTQLIQANITDADGAQTNAALITVSAGTKIVVTHITVTADGANTTDVQCRIGFGTANTPSNDAAKVLLSHPGIKAGSGISLGNGGGILGVGADDEDLRITCEDPVSGALDVVVGYYTIES